MSNEIADPCFEPSARGISHHFNKRFQVSELYSQAKIVLLILRYTIDFCIKNRVDFIVRGHQVVQVRFCLIYIFIRDCFQVFPGIPWDFMEYEGFETLFVFLSLIDPLTLTEPK